MFAFLQSACHRVATFWHSTIDKLKNTWIWDKTKAIATALWPVVNVAGVLVGSVVSMKPWNELVNWYVFESIHHTIIGGDGFVTLLPLSWVCGASELFLSAPLALYCGLNWTVGAPLIPWLFKHLAQETHHCRQKQGVCGTDGEIERHCTSHLHRPMMCAMREV
jgi:hypothetical protein